MKQPFDSNQDILEALRSKDPHRVNAALKHLYQSGKLTGTVKQQVKGLGGDENDAREVLNRALVVFYNHVEDGKYDPALSGITTYIVHIATRMFYTVRRSETRRVAMHDRSMEADAVETVTNPELEMNIRHRKELLDKVLSMIGDKCRQLLKLRSFDFSMAEIAEKMNYKSPDVAKMAAQDCRKKLNHYLAERPGLLAELNEL